MQRVRARVEEVLILAAAAVAFVFVGFASAIMTVSDRRMGRSA